MDILDHKNQKQLVEFLSNHQEYNRRHGIKDETLLHRLNRVYILIGNVFAEDLACAFLKQLKTEMPKLNTQAWNILQSVLVDQSRISDRCVVYQELQDKWYEWK